MTRIDDLVTPVRKRLNAAFDEELRFFKGWLDSPKGVGAIVPTSMVTARAMAAVIRPESGLPVLELGPGTGVITRAILERGIVPEKLYSVEYSRDFAENLRQSFPEIHVIEGDAFALDDTLGAARDLTFDAVICALPLLSFPREQRQALVHDLLRRVPPGRPVIQLTYGPMSPVRAEPGLEVEHHDFILRNLPPTQLWIYRKGANA